MEAADEECSGFTSCYEEPIARVMYFNNKLSFQAQRRIEETVQTIAGNRTNSETTTTDQQVKTYSESQGLIKSDDDSINYVEYYQEFCLDWLGMPACQIEALEIIYQQVYTGVFWIDEFAAREETRLRKLAIKCFNCNDDHHLRDCTQLKDWSRISAQYSMFKASLPTHGADTRYHTLTLSHSRFNKFTPGKISEKLAKALGLSCSTDVPPYISRMKHLGYPPGYKLAEEDDCLALFDSVCADSASNKVQTSSVNEITYPGFNAPDVVESEPEPTDTTITDLEELGTLSEYEFEEEDGGVGFGLKKLLQSDKQQETKENNFSLDFPPGLVHLDEDSETCTSGKWDAIKSLIHKRTK